MRRLIAPALALLLLLGGCAPDRAGEDPAADGRCSVWFLSGQNGGQDAALASELRPLPEGAGETEGLLKLLLSGPVSGGLSSPFPPGTAVRSWQLEDGLLTVDLSEAYGGLSGVELSLADGCMVLTLCQTEGVDAVYLTVEGASRPFRDQVLSAGDFLLDNGVGGESTAEVRLWFLREDGLDSEERTLTLAMGDRADVAALQALLAGPESGELEAICPPGTALLSLSARGSRYTVDLGESWRVVDEQGEELQDPRRVRAIVETLVELDPEAQVLLQVGGEPLESFGGLDLSRPLGADIP